MAASATFLMLFAVSPGAAAGTARPTSWWVDSASCENWSTALARAITLACDAAGHTCEVSAQRIATADARQLTLHCSGTDHWTLEAHDGVGTGLWHIEVQGDTDERLRAAALWVARSDVAMADSAYDAIPANAKLVTPSNENRDTAPNKDMAPGPNVGGISLAGQILFLPKGPYSAPSFLMYGGALRIMDSGNTFSWLLPRVVRLFLAFSGEYGGPDSVSVGGYENDSNFIRFRLGPGVAWTVPGTRNAVSLWLEGGVGYARRDWVYSTAPASTPGGTPSSSPSSDSQHRALAYGQLGTTVQIPLEGNIHPLASIGIGVTGPNSYTGVVYGTLAIGCAWNAW
ncbi:hypothetical protein [Pendulispora albinea]|uniref:Uncharacterized protein n=1 Tax=Pendulispora albinea TaxID=2741071 RepID=A0ABZ2LV93_9BACT